MSQNFSPNLFLFQSYVGEVVKEGKKYIKTTPFETVDPDTFLAGDKNQHLDLYHQYFLAAMGHQKTREIACSNYEKLIRQGLVDKDHLPISMISSVLGACSSLGSSTSGSSSLGSASLAINTQAQSLYIGNLLKSILLCSYQPMSELVIGLNYLLEGTRKKYSQLYASMLEDIYSSLLIKFHDAPLRRLVSSYLRNLIDEVQAHFMQEGYVFASRKLNLQTNKVQMPLFVEGNGFGKFGRCFICGKSASHYMKEEYIPICSIECKDRVRQLLQECRTTEYFNVFAWVLDNLPTGDEIICSFLLRELHYYAGKQTLTFSQLLVIVKTAIHLVGNLQLSSHLMPCLAMAITRWRSLVRNEEVTAENNERLQHYFKTYYLQIITIVEEANIGKEMNEYVLFFANVLKDERTFHEIFVRYDCKFYEPNILARMMNILSQYAKKYEDMVEQLQGVVKMLMRRYIEHNEREDNWSLHGQFLKKRELKKVIALFNKKPTHGIKYFKKMFELKDEQLNAGETEKPISVMGSDSRVDEDSESGSSAQKDSKVQIGEQSPKQKKVHSLEQVPQTKGETMEETFDATKEINQKIEEIVQQHVSKKQKNSDQQSLEKKPVVNKSIRSKVTPKDIAIFIRQNLQYRSWTQTEMKHPIPIFALQKVKVGEYFGVDDPEVRQVSKYFLNDFPFDDVDIDDVLRIVLNSFTLPKETQQIERIIGDLSLRLLGRYNMNDETGLYQYIYLLLMVQTSNQNPNVKQKERLTLQNHLSMCKHITGGIIKDRAVNDFQRIIQNPLDKRMKYPDQSIFVKKYLDKLEQHSAVLLEGQQESDSLSKDILLYIWEYLIIGLVWPGNTKGLWESVILLGREGLAEEQKGFFEALRKEGEGHEAGSEINSMILKLGIDYGNDLHGRLWNYVISLIYGLQNQNEYNSAVLDKLFTNSGSLLPLRLRDFIESLLMFSNSEFKKDTLYNRELFVLRHINSLLEYNIPRFPLLAPHVWQLLDRYFRDICLHPRREIAMAAIDSYKQLTLKLFKLREEAVPHQAIMDTYCHIFERSCLEMKDLIANVLLNLITPDMRGGWQSVYAILDVLDTKDKQLVVKIIGRFISEVGLQRLTSLPRLHGICIKQLRVCGDSVAVQQLLGKLWQLSKFIDEADTWLQTIRSIKDIFKISLNNELLVVFVRMSNLCLRGQQQLNKQIFSEVVDLLIFLIELKMVGSHNKVIHVLLCSLQSLRELDCEFIISYVGGSYGFLSIYQMYLSSENKLPFALFLKDYFINVLLPSLVGGQHFLQLQQLCQWCINQYYDNLPGQLVNLKEKDKDFDKGLEVLLQELKGEVERDRSERQSELIQFHLSHKDYHQKSTLHLIFLDVIEEIYRQMGLKQIEHVESLERVRMKIIESAIDSYECAVKINKLVLMRNFLWNNGFLSAKALPGLHKQEHRTLTFIIKYFPFSKTYPLLVKFMQHYLSMYDYLGQLRVIEARAEPPLPKGVKSGRKPEQKEDIKSYGIYCNDTLLWINESKRCLSLGLTELRCQLGKAPECRWLRDEVEHSKLIVVCTRLLQLKSLPGILIPQVCQTLKLLYQLVL